MSEKLPMKLCGGLCMNAAFISLLLGILGSTLPANIYAANILAVFPSVWQSHNIFGRRLLEQLANKANYSVTLIRSKDGDNFTLQDWTSPATTALREIHVDGLQKNWEDMGLSFDIEQAYQQSVLERFTRLVYGGTANVDLLLNDANVRKLLRSDEKFDLLIADLFLSDALLGISLYYDIPTIVLSPTGANSWLSRMIGNPQSSALDPSDFLPYSERMSISERCLNTLMSLFEKLTYNFFYMISQQAVYVKHFQPLFQLANLSYANNLPHHRELTKNLSLILMNTHPVIQYPRAFLPNILTVGGLHLRNDLQLPNHLKDFIDTSPHGVIYVSLGANAKTVDLAHDKRDALLDVITYMPDIRFIVKWEIDDDTGDIPPNMLINAYFPQQAILAHPKVKGFISACGVMSVMEAINGLTPILAIPIYPDQVVLAKRLEAQGAAITVPFDAIAYDSLYYGLEQILRNTSYLKSMESLHSFFRTDFGSPIDRSLHYIDLVLKTKGADFLRSHANQLNFLRTELFDVIAILAFGLCGILAVPFLVICGILRRSYYSNQAALFASREASIAKQGNLGRGNPKPQMSVKKARAHMSTPSQHVKTITVTTKTGRRPTAGRRLSASAVILTKNEDNSYCSVSSASLSSSSSSSSSMSSTPSSVPSSPSPTTSLTLQHFYSKRDFEKKKPAA